MSELNKNQKEILKELVVSEKDIIERYEKELKHLTHQKMISEYRKVSDKFHRATWLFNTLYKRQKDINAKQLENSVQKEKVRKVLDMQFSHGVDLYCEKCNKLYFRDIEELKKQLLPDGTRSSGNFVGEK